MKKILFTAVFLGLLSILSASPILVEAYQVGNISIPPKEYDTVSVVEVSFNVDTSCYVQLSTGGLAALSRCWFTLDGEVLPPAAWLGSTVNPEGFAITYTYLIGAGQHLVKLRLTDNKNQFDPTTCQNAYLQALIFLPDSASAVAEQPAVETLRPVTNAVISRGPYVSAPGASMVVDASGRVMENVLVDSKVQISSLPAGTYYAKDEERTVVKIVKVD